jgi:erythronate-4-phosphate dehydrogenase
MKIVADENIPYARQAFKSLGEVTTLPGRNLKPQDIQDCECLLVRSITQVNKALLKNSSVRFVASATIGTDHIDLDYLQQNDIGFANAPGCNAESAAEYMINVLFHLAQKKNFDPFGLTAGIIGHGNVGSRVKNKLDALGIKTLVNDPPLQHSGDDSQNFVSLQTILHECNFITCHVPLTRDGEHPTWHLFNGALLNKLGRNTLLFNAARGAVIDNNALSALLKSRDDLTVFLDTWEGEPRIDQTLLKQVDFASPHIAGYSVEGRLRGTQMILHAACDYFDIHASWKMQDYLPGKQLLKLYESHTPSLWYELFNKHYVVENDYHALLKLADANPKVLATGFDLLRKNYPPRYEYDQFVVENTADKKTASQIERLMFNLKI